MRGLQAEHECSTSPAPESGSDKSASGQGGSIPDYCGYNKKILDGSDKQHMKASPFLLLASLHIVSEHTGWLNPKVHLVQHPVSNSGQSEAQSGELNRFPVQPTFLSLVKPFPAHNPMMQSSFPTKAPLAWEPWSASQNARGLSSHETCTAFQGRSGSHPVPLPHLLKPDYIHFLADLGIS